MRLISFSRGKPACGLTTMHVGVYWSCWFVTLTIPPQSALSIYIFYFTSFVMTTGTLSWPNKMYCHDWVNAVQGVA
jgi:hypothetical protein